MSLLQPALLRDPRFRAGRKLVTSAEGDTEQAVNLFASLLEKCRALYRQDDHIECAAAYYEYGNALFRSLHNNNAADEEEEDEDEDGQEEEEEVASSKRSAAALAAEKRLAGRQSSPGDSDKKKPPPDVTAEKNGKKRAEGQDESTIAITADAKDAETAARAKEDAQEEENDGDQEEEEEEEDDDDVDGDLELALEMMETAWAILDQHLAAESTPKYREWATQEFPRYLTGIGDVLSALHRHADAADVYSRAAQHWQALNQQQQTNKGATPSLSELRIRRRIAETFILVAEEFLASPADENVVTTETKSLLCRAHERVEYARGYYDKARDELQEVVLLLGQLVASHNHHKAAFSETELQQEKENVCLASTLIMGVGTTLAELDEQQQHAGTRDEAKPPARKKSKRL